MSTRDDDDARRVFDDAMRAAKTQFDVHECVDWLIDLVAERAARDENAGAAGSSAGSNGGLTGDEDEEEGEEECEEEEEEEVEYEDESKDGKGAEVEEVASKEDAEQVAGGPPEVAAPGAAADASTQPPLTKRAAAEAAFRHIKYSWGRVHAHPSLDDDEVNTLMAHVGASNHMPAKDLFLMVCDIDGAVLVVSPRLQSTKSEEQSSALALACDNVAHVDGVDIRILSPLLIYCFTASARQELAKAVSGVEAYVGEWSLLCARPVKHNGGVELGLSLQVPSHARDSILLGCGAYVAHGLCGAPPPPPPILGVAARTRHRVGSSP